MDDSQFLFVHDDVDDQKHEASPRVERWTIGIAYFECVQVTFVS